MSDFENNAGVSDMAQVDLDPGAAISQQSFDPSEGASRSKTSSMNINGSEDSDKNPDNVSTSFEIIVPKIANPEDYDYLPGRFEAFSILAVDMYEPKLIVRLKSGERTTITAKQLLKLTNGPHVLRDFLDGSQSPDPLSMNLDPKPHLIHTSGDGADDVDDSVTRQIGIARNRQRRLGISGASFSHFFSTRSTRNNEKVVQDSSSSEELENIESSPAPSTDSEDVRPNRRRHLRRGAQKNKRRRTRESSEESLASERGTRVSTRLKKAAKYNFKERMEDDEMSEVEVVAPKKKFSGAKEQFVELPEDDPFREAHSSKCFSCGRWEDESSREETLVYCQGCTSSYHRECLGTRAARKHLVTKVGADNFILQCSRCLGIKHRDHDILPHLGHCAVCKEAGPMSTPLRDSYTAQEEQQLREENGGIDPTTEVEMSRVNNIDNVLTRCTRCKRAFHIEHILPTPGADRSEIRPEYWHCSDCSNLPDEILPIGVIVAWRPKTDVKVVPGLVELVPEIEKEYLVKWAKKSYFHVVWMPGDWVWCMAHAAMFQTFLKSPKANKPIWTIEEAVPEENLRIDIVFDVEYTREPESAEERANPELVERVFVKFQGLPYEETLWEFPPAQTDVARWEAFKNALADKVFAESIQPPKYKALQERLKAAREKDFEKDLVLKSQPKMVTGGKLMEYQLDGVNWMYYMYFQRRNAILADDMGLGKTLQVIALLSAMMENHQCFPFLIVVPNSTVPNWRREIKKWAPEMRVVAYFGSAWARQMVEKHEMFHNGELCCHVVIVSYESMSDASAARVLGRVHWAALIVDEGQRLKNDQSLLYGRLRRMKFGFKLLLTGTPLQNNIRELFNLIQFLDPTKDAEKLEEQYGNAHLTKEEIRELHDMIRPCFLRRTKAEVLPFLPPMVQIIIPVSMSVVQKKLYRSILEKNPMLIQTILKRHKGQMNKKDRHNLNNILIQLRKCLCHPFIYNRNIEEQTRDLALAHQRLVEASGKLQLLNLMLPQLQQRGHRVLIFSQFLENLDIVEDFLGGVGLQFCRLDGQLSSAEKQKQIDEFNAPNSPVFAFLLSTRSGGVGINLATADTVIIMDPDFNPKQDMQALSRAHRIGQKNTVLVFHLVVRASVEEKIMQKGKTKLALDHVLIDRMEADEDEEDLESILQHGAQALFNGDDSADIKYDIPAIEKLLDRSQAEQAEVITNGDDSNSNNQNQLNFARVWQMDRDSLEEVVETEEAPVDISAWQKILDEREREAKEHLSRQDEGLGRGKRKRPTISYNTKMGDDDDPELSPTASPMAKMRKIVPDQDYQEPDGEAAQSESDNESEFTRDQLDLDTAGKQDYLNVMNSRNFLAPEVDESQLATRRFRRVELPLPLSPQGDLDGANDLLQPCQACQQNHVAGSCPLRLAGPELCPLCGLAHYGYRRSCPHLQSTAHVQQMLQALDLSTEDPRLVAIARRYLQTCITSNQNLERRKAVAAQVSAQLVASPQVDAARIDGEHIGPDNDVNSGVDDGVMEGVVDLTQ